MGGLMSQHVGCLLHFNWHNDAIILSLIFPLEPVLLEEAANNKKCTHNSEMQMMLILLDHTWTTISMQCWVRWQNRKTWSNDSICLSLALGEGTEEISKFQEGNLNLWQELLYSVDPSFIIFYNHNILCTSTFKLVPSFIPHIQFCMFIQHNDVAWS